MKKLIVFTGAGVSSESGLKTFRDSNGLWEEYNVMDVATPEAWAQNPELVLEFYNKRRQQIIDAQPNAAHFAIAELQDTFDTQVITQNIDDLHERAGCKNVLHLHGEIKKSRSTADPSKIYDIEGAELNPGETCELGSQLRPDVVWFGEAVPNISIAQEMISKANIVMIVGTSLNVYPAAGLIFFAPTFSEKYLIDPAEVNVTDIDNLTVIREIASLGVPRVAKKLLEMAHL